MIVESITGPDDFTVGSKIVLRGAHKNFSYHVYEVLSVVNGNISVSSYYNMKKDGTKVNATSYIYTASDFRPFHQWEKITEFMPYDPTQQGDTSDDI